MKSNMKKQDIIFITGIFLIGILLFAGYHLWYHTPGSMVEITIDGTVYQTLALEKDTTIEIPTDAGSNILKIHNGIADMTNADCPDKLCVNQKPVSHTGETLVCLPHKVIVKVTNGADRTETVPDGVAH